jgi:hypothetical protein
VDSWAVIVQLLQRGHYLCWDLRTRYAQRVMHLHCIFAAACAHTFATYKWLVFLAHLQGAHGCDKGTGALQVWLGSCRLLPHLRNHC